MTNLREAMLRAGFRKTKSLCLCCGVPYPQCYKLRESNRRIREEYIRKGIILAVVSKLVKDGEHNT